MNDPNLQAYLEYLWFNSLWNHVFYGLVLAVGTAFAFMGYRLFGLGLFGKGKEAGDLEAVFNDWRLVFKRAAPGSFFALCGTVLVGIALWQPGFHAIDYYGGGQPPPPNSTKMLFITPETDGIIQKALRGEALTESERKKTVELADQLKTVPVSKS